MTFGYKTMGEPMATICMLHDILWMTFCGCMLCCILGNLLSFVLMVFSLCCRYSDFQMKGLGLITKHTPHVSVFCELLRFVNVLLKLNYSGFYGKYMY